MSDDAIVIDEVSTFVTRPAKISRYVRREGNVVFVDFKADRRLTCANCFDSLGPGEMVYCSSGCRDEFARRELAEMLGEEQK